jgi:hypothetical protein
MKGLNIIYYFESSQNQNDEFRPAKYKILYAFDTNGMLEIRDTFNSLDDLKSFALELVQSKDGGEVRLISVQDYNVGVEGAKDRNSFRQIFSSFGEVVLDPTKSKKKGIFGNLF